MTVAGNLIMLLFAIIQRMALRLTYGARGAQPDDKVYFALSVLNWLLFLGAIVPLLVVMPWWIGLMLGLLILGAVDEGLRASRQLQRQTTITLLSLAAARGLPVGGAVLRHATDQGGSVGRATRRLVRELEQGDELTSAIRRNRRAVPREAVAYTAVGEAIGDRPRALAEAGRRPPSVLSGLYRLLVDRVGYLALLGLFTLTIGTYMIVRIVPEFAKIFAEFALPMPLATRSLIVVSGIVVENAIVLIPLASAVLLALFVVAVLSFFGVPVLRVIGDRAMAGRHRAVVLRSLAMAAELGRPLDLALQALAARYPSPSWRRRLATAWRDQQGGTDWSDALLRARIIRGGTYALVRAGQRVGNLPWTLRIAADREESREAYRWTAVVQVVFPLLILAIAAAVGFVCYALFVPLAELILQMAPAA
jgi:type II secretory pathway component PulF